MGNNRNFFINSILTDDELAKYVEEGWTVEHRDTESGEVRLTKPYVSPYGGE